MVRVFVTYKIMKKALLFNSQFLYLLKSFSLSSLFIVSLLISFSLPFSLPPPYCFVGPMNAFWIEVLWVDILVLSLTLKDEVQYLTFKNIVKNMKNNENNHVNCRFSKTPFTFVCFQTISLNLLYSLDILFVRFIHGR